MSFPIKIWGKSAQRFLSYDRKNKQTNRDYNFIYRVSHETWQLVNGFECLLPYIILDIINFFQFISLTNAFTQIYLTLKSIFYKMTTMLYFLLFSSVSKNLTNYGRRHLKLFTNCHVSWDTLYIIFTDRREPINMRIMTSDKRSSLVIHSTRITKPYFLKSELISCFACSFYLNSV